ncbi:LacI family DNA-binding transcriptional regulator [Rhizobium chutanense]|uniref:LacI family transcriptional regulator n=1 Tax=Rhizobium chutanense TaxID=2035448 RepID=A0A2A6J1G5_9HYPH|nr:LacI family DNA-binding transcriptional regulator [Rhizobium chutanense]PDS99975.1 LacI family transcriptional regulator [Rhizobium chutanense]RUM06003.1 LacI family transcriptional regulator [Rhizobium chutanense]
MTKPPTIRDVARLSGVSTATVSRYFSGKADAIAPRTIESVRQAAKSLGYTPSEIGRSLRLAQSRVVVMLVPDATNHFTADIAVSVESALKGIGLSMVLANTGENAAQQDRLLADAQGLRARAIVLQGAIDTPRLRELVAKQGNLIFANRRPAQGIVAPYVGIDNFQAGLAVGRYFIERGYENWVAIHGPRHYFGSTARLDGFVSGVGDASRVLQLESPYTMQAGYEHACRLLDLEPKKYSVFCANDMIAYGFYRAAMERNLRVPDDLVIFGFDDNRLNEWLAPWLTTVKVPALEFGPAIAKLIETPKPGFEDGRSIILPFELKVRQSA